MDKINTSETFEELAKVAIEILRQMSLSGKPIVEICGPVSTGGLGSIEKNLSILKKAVDKANEKGLQTFDQTIFEEAMQRISKKYPLVDGYPVSILDKFYKKIFESGYIKKAYFLPGWQSSRGAKWEREIFPIIGVEIAEYPIEWLKEIENS